MGLVFMHACLHIICIHSFTLSLHLFSTCSPALFPVPQVTAYNRDSFDTTRQQLIMMIEDPEGISVPIPFLYWCQS